MAQWSQPGLVLSVQALYRLQGESHLRLFSAGGEKMPHHSLQFIVVYLYVNQSVYLFLCHSFLTCSGYIFAKLDNPSHLNCEWECIPRKYCSIIKQVGSIINRHSSETTFNVTICMLATANRALLNLCPFIGGYISKNINTNIVKQLV